MFGFITKFILLAVPLVIVVSAIVLLPRLVNNSKALPASASEGNATAVPVLASADINKEFHFPFSEDGSNKVKFVVEKARLQNEIVLKGQKATSVSGKTFLIFDLKIVNDTNASASINTRDYIRLSPKDHEDLSAPELFNDPVEVLPISSKETRVGFSVDNSDLNFILQIGEIEGEKEKIFVDLVK